MRLIHIVLVSVLAGWLQLAGAAEIIPVKKALPPSADKTVVLTITQGGKATRLTLADIERLPMYQTTLRTSWGMNGTFHGVLMSDLMMAYKFNEAKRIVFHARDNYVAGLTKGEFNNSPAFLATRLDGKPIPLDNKGPLILLWPSREEAALQGKAASSWVWSIAEIAPE